MRLIDVDKLILSLNDYSLQETPNENESTGERRISRMVYQTIQNCIRAVEEQPTAYDVDKVVEQLENERELSYADFDRYVEEVSPTLDDEYDDFFHRGLERAIGVVKGGGADV